MKYRVLAVLFVMTIVLSGCGVYAPFVRTPGQVAAEVEAARADMQIRQEKAAAEIEAKRAEMQIQQEKAAAEIEVKRAEMVIAAKRAETINTIFSVLGGCLAIAVLCGAAWMLKKSRTHKPDDVVRHGTVYFNLATGASSVVENVSIFWRVVFYLLGMRHSGPAVNITPPNETAAALQTQVRVAAAQNQRLGHIVIGGQRLLGADAPTAPPALPAPGDEPPRLQLPSPFDRGGGPEISVVAPAIGGVRPPIDI